MKRRDDHLGKQPKHSVLSWIATAILGCVILLLVSTAQALVKGPLINAVTAIPAQVDSPISADAEVASRANPALAAPA